MSGSKGILTSLIPNCSVLCTLIILISYHNRRNLMTGSERRQELLQLLSGTQTPISGTSLAKHFTVSRQVIVQDMALLRAQGHEVLSTNRGYLIQVFPVFSKFFTPVNRLSMSYALLWISAAPLKMSLFIIKSTASSRHLCIFHHAETYSSFWKS